MGKATFVKEWLRLARMDIESAEHLLSMRPLPIEIICYHCQQSVEKHLKAYLVSCGKIPSKTHDLDELCRMCKRNSEDFSKIADYCSDLTAYGVQPRYPMELNLEEHDMQQALKEAKEIEKFIYEKLEK